MEVFVFVIVFVMVNGQQSTVNGQAIRMEVFVFVIVMVNGQQSMVYGLHPEGSQKLTANGQKSTVNRRQTESIDKLA